MVSPKKEYRTMFCCCDHVGNKRKNTNDLIKSDPTNVSYTMIARSQGHIILE